MRRSDDRILTTHVGSLPGPRYLEDEPDLEAKLRMDVAEVVGRQRELGIDLINEGEYTKGGDWLSFMDYRFGGYEPRPDEGDKPLLLQGKDRDEFADFYDYASRKGTLFYLEDDRLIATHYCDAGNRPRMAGRVSPDGKRVEFDFVELSGSNQYGHMHGVAFTFIDENHHTVEWTWMRPDDTPLLVRFDLQRTTMESGLLGS